MVTTPSAATVGLRKLISEPMALSLEGTRAPPLELVVSDQVPRRGIQEKLGESVLAQHTPWFTELVLSTRDDRQKIVVYRIPVLDDVWLHAACLGQQPEVMINLMAGPDYGDHVTALVQRHWPDLFAMLTASNRRVFDQRLLLRVHTASTWQWLVADPVHDDSVSKTAIEDLVGAALRTAIRVGDPIEQLPGLFPVLAGPDRLSRRLKAVGDLFSMVGSLDGLATGLADGQAVQVEDLIDLVDALRDLPDALLRIRD